MLDKMNKKVLGVLSAATAATAILTSSPDNINAANPPPGIESQKSRKSWREELKRELINTKEGALQLLEARKRYLESLKSLIEVNTKLIEGTKRIRNRSQSEERKAEFDKAIASLESQTKGLREAAEALEQDNAEFERFINEEMR